MQRGCGRKDAWYRHLLVEKCWQYVFPVALKRPSLRTLQLPVCPQFLLIVLRREYDGNQCLLAVYIAQVPEEVLPPPSPRKYWSRRGVAIWLADLLKEDVPTIVGIDHGFSFPLRYFEVHGSYRTGMRFWKTSRHTGQRTKNTSMSTSCEMDSSEMAARGRETRDGDA